MCIRLLSFCISRGFGFITFGDPNSVDKVLAHGTHELDGKKVRTDYWLCWMRIHSVRSLPNDEGDSKSCCCRSWPCPPTRRWCLDVMCSQIFICRTRIPTPTSSRYSNPVLSYIGTRQGKVRNSWQFQTICSHLPCRFQLMCTWKGFHFLRSVCPGGQGVGLHRDWRRSEMTKRICSLFPFCDRSIG